MLKENPVTVEVTVEVKKPRHFSQKNTNLGSPWIPLDSLTIKLASLHA